MQRFSGIAILAVGIVLIVMGVNASHSIGSDISRFFTGAVTNKSIYLLAAGVIVLFVGSSMAYVGRSRPA